MNLSAANTASATNAAAVLTFGQTVDTSPAQILQGGIIFSYSATPTNGSLTITEGGITVFGPVWITEAGAGFLDFNELAGDRGKAVVITLAAGGSGVVGNITVKGSRTS